MKRGLTSLPLLLAVCIAATASTSGQQSAGPAPTGAPADGPLDRALLDQYCLECHDDVTMKGDLTLESLDVTNVGAASATWEKVVQKLRAGAMPPPGRERPAKAHALAFVTKLERELDRHAAAHPDPGRPAIHRLNRVEYRNAIRDLFGLDVDVESLLPSDDASFGFDNIGDVLTVSPTLLERYLAAAGRIARMAVGDTTNGASAETYTLPQRLVQNEHASDDLPFGSRGGVAIRHYFPVDGEYVIKVRLQRDRVRDIIGLRDRHTLDVRLDGVRIVEWQVGGERPTPNADAVHDEETYERTADATFDVRVRAKAGERVLGATFVNRTIALEGPLRRSVGLAQYAQDDDVPGIGSITIVGPYGTTSPGDTESRRRIFTCRPAAGDDGVACATTILSALARRAYRGFADADDLATLLDFYRRGHEEGGFESGIGLALRRMLVSPRFLFRIERDPDGVAPGTVYRLSDLELASRLSFFLWSSIPDDELLQAAERGALRDAATFERHVRRMLADTKADALVKNFGGQWLYVRNIQKVVPDPEMFPEFDENLRDALRQETELVLGSMVREDRSVLELLDASYTFVNERLARHYGIPGVYGSRFRRVALADDARRGVIGKGAVLTVTSYASRTSPTFRGKWVLENLLGSPPPQPPNNVPSLKDRDEGGRVLSARDQIELHRRNPACSVCHLGMDPLGFALENFDAIGRWRTTSGAGNTPIDASGVLPDGTRFAGPSELRRVLLDRRSEFVQTFTGKLLTYALGRGLDYRDAPTIRTIARDASAHDQRWSSLVLGIVRSQPFQTRRSPGP